MSETRFHWCGAAVGFVVGLHAHLTGVTRTSASTGEWAEEGHALRRQLDLLVAHLPSRETLDAESEWAGALYEFLLREFSHPDPSSGEVVTADVRPHFTALCNFIGRKQ